jgi:phospholipase C
MNLKCARVLASLLIALSLTVIAPGSLRAQGNDADGVATTTPIKHVVVIFQENISFDHYFATYPHAANPEGEPAFHAKGDTPRVNNLLSGGLLTENPNSTQPFRLDRSQAVTCDQNHAYDAEQKAFDHGLMDKFPEFVGSGGPGCFDAGKGTGLVMGYYDGNTVTAMWNYAQRFAMSDNSYSTTFGPSTPGALNLTAGNTFNATVVSGSPKGNIADAASTGAIIGDPRPAGDDCNPKNKTYVTVSGTNVGDLLNAKELTWGWFQGGFGRTAVDAGGIATCGAVSTGLAATLPDYIAHHEPFQYFSQTANLHHLPPSSPSLIGKTDQANHQYDLSDFWTAFNEDKLPAVSFLKAKAAFDGHPGYSDPLDEQTFLVDTINKLQQSKEWKQMAIIILYDDSDGWYDHAMDPVVNQSSVADDFLSDVGHCGTTPTGAIPGRCGYGPRQPLLVISPYSKKNYVDHRITDQSSVLRFIEDNWTLGQIGGSSTDVKAGKLNGMFDFDDHPDGEDLNRRKLILDPVTGLVVSN